MTLYTKIKSKYCVQAGMRILYHGSPVKGIKKFELGKSSNWGQRMGKGFYVTPDRKTAERYMEDAKGNTGELYAFQMPAEKIADVTNEKGFNEVVKKLGITPWKFAGDPLTAIRHGLGKKLDVQVLVNSDYLRDAFKEIGYEAVQYSSKKNYDEDAILVFELNSLTPIKVP